MFVLARSGTFISFTRQTTVAPLLVHLEVVNEVGRLVLLVPVHVRVELVEAHIDPLVTCRLKVKYQR